MNDEKTPNATHTPYPDHGTDSAIQHLFTKYAFYLDENRAESIEGTITSIEFEMVRIKEKDTHACMIVPAWKVHGTVQAKLTEEYEVRILDKQIMTVLRSDLLLYCDKYLLFVDKYLLT